MPGTRKLGRTSDSRNAMMRAYVVTYLLENGKIGDYCHSRHDRSFHGREDDHPG